MMQGERKKRECVCEWSLLNLVVQKVKVASFDYSNARIWLLVKELLSLVTLL